MSVRDYLISQGLSREHVSAQGLGESQPVASNDSASGRQENRRVEIVVLEAPEFGMRVTSQ